MKQYNYPIDADWSMEEIIDVTNFFNRIEDAYEAEVKAEDVLSSYRAFEKVVPSKAEEKTLFRQFAADSGYESYPVVKRAQEGISPITMKEERH